MVRNRPVLGVVDVGLGCAAVVHEPLGVVVAVRPTEGRDYANLFQEVMEEPPPKWTPKPWPEFRPDPEFKPRWTSLIPDSWKRPIRQWIANSGLRLG